MSLWLKRVLVVVLLIPAVVLLLISWLIGPYVLDDQRLDAIVMGVALDWRDFGEIKARQRLQYELDHQIGLQVGDDHCQFVEDDRGKHVSCAWSVRVPIPAAQRVIPLSFASSATISPDGELR